MQWLSEYGIFLAEVATIVVALIVVMLTFFLLLAKNKYRPKEELQITKLNDKYEDMADALHEKTLDKHERKKLKKEEKKAKKAMEKQTKKKHVQRKKIYVLDFQGDIRASHVKNLREEITAILTVAKPDDEVIAKIESAGGIVHAYGLAASQLQRIVDRDIHLTVTIDKVAASGGYMMACVANKIIAAPFAIVGSIGVIAQLPNFNKMLKKNNVEFEQVSAGEYKRTLTVFGENTKKGRNKFQEEIDDTHKLFKEFVKMHRTNVNLDKIGTGEYWFAKRTLDLDFKLVDQLATSDDYLLEASKDADIYEVKYRIRKGLMGRFTNTVQQGVDQLMNLLLKNL